MTTGMNSAPLDRLMVFTGNANPRLAQDVAKHLNLPIGRAIVGKFSDGEVLVELIENVRGKDAFVLQSTCAPTNDNLMELLVMIDALKRSSAARVTAAIPYFGYARQDRRPRSEEHTSELQSRLHLVCRLLLEKKKKKIMKRTRPSHMFREITELRIR